MPVPGGYVDAGNGNLHIEIPIASMAERGHVPFVAKLVYDSHIWQQVSGAWQPTNVLNSNSGWRLMTSAAAGSNLNYKIQSSTCERIVNRIITHPPFTTYEDFSWTAPDGHIIPFGTINTINYGECGTSISTASGVATDASGYHMSVTNYTAATVYAPDGTQVYPYVEDTNGNYYSTPNSNGDVTDTLGRKPIATTVNGDTTTYAVLNSQGSTSDFIVTTETIPVSTDFGQSGVTEYFSTAPSTNYLTVIQSIALPDGTSYQFSYDTGLTSGHYGTLTAMTLPTLGTVEYNYKNFKDAYGNQNIWAASSSWGGATGGTWSYTPLVLQSCPTGCTQQMTEVGPSGEKTVFGFTLNEGAWDTSAASYDTTANGGGLLRTVATAYNFSNAPYILPTTVTTMLPVSGGNVSQTKTYYFDSSNFGNVTQLTETNFSGTAYRSTTYAYLANSDNNMVNKKQTISVCPGSAQCTSSTYVSSTQIAYDGATTSSVTGVIDHDDTNFGTTYTARGNPTTIQLMGGGTAVSATTTLTYDMTGQVTSSQDNNSNVTKFSYVDSYFNDSSSGPTSTTPAGKTNAFVTQVTLPNPFNWTNSFAYYLGTSQAATKADQNGVVSTTHYLDPLSRPTMKQVPINATNYSWKMMSYAASSETQADSYSGIADASPSLTCSSCRHDQMNLDSFGRPLTQILVNDPEGADTVTATYANGRLSSETNSERSASSPTDGSDSYTYDGLGRVSKVTHSDGSSASTYFGANVSTAGGISAQLCSSSTYGLGYPVLLIDEASKKRQIWSDAFGRKIEVDETDNSGNLTQNTCYTYNIVNNLTGVTQGTQTRTYTYDSVSRVVSATTPENAISYIYNVGGTSPCSGNAALVCQRYDQARQIFTTYTYDQLNRLTGVSYSNNKAPTLTYTYDAGTNQKGFLTGMTDGSGSTTWAYNNVGWVTTEQRTIAGKTNSISYTYNGDGTTASVTYPSSRTITYAVSNAERPISTKDVANNIQYAVTASYAPVGALNSVIYGPASGFNGVTASAAHNSRLETTTISATSSAGTAQNLTFNYNLPTGNDGTINSIQNGVTAGLGESFTYDSLNRILSASTTATSGAGCWGQSFGPSGTPPPGPPDDRWSNITEINVTQCSAGALSIAVSSATNQVTTTGFSYDAAGNMTSEPAPNGFTYTYDGENHLTQAAGTPTGTWTYVYDGRGLRVEKSNASGGTIYWRSISGDTIAETDLTGSTTNAAYKEYIFFAGQRIASRDSSANVYYFYRDQIGSITAITNASGTPCYQATFTPYGQEMATETTCPSNYKFTGYERDAETGLDYAFARYYNSRLGRFMSPDPLAGSSSDPQTLNRYAYGGNNPINFTDPSGMYLQYPCSSVGICDFGDQCNINGAPQYCGGLYSQLLFYSQFDTSYTFAAGPNFDPGQLSLSQLLTMASVGEITLVGTSIDGFQIMVGNGIPITNVPALKSALLTLLKNNKDCAAILGGITQATALVSQANMVDTVVPLDTSKLDADPNFQAVQGGQRAGITLFSTTQPGGSWDGGSFYVFFGPLFQTYSPSARMTLTVHELSHPLNPSTDIDTQADVDNIALKCLTEPIPSGH